MEYLSQAVPKVPEIKFTRLTWIFQKSSQLPCLLMSLWDLKNASLCTVGSFLVDLSGLIYNIIPYISNLTNLDFRNLIFPFLNRVVWFKKYLSTKLYSDFCQKMANARVKFIYSEKATKFCEIFPLLLTTVHTTLSRSGVWIGMKVLGADSIILGTRKLWWMFPIKQKLNITAAFFHTIHAIKMFKTRQFFW